MAVARQVILGVRLHTLEAAGNELDAAVRKHARFVCKLAYSVLRDPHDAEDVTQETVLRFWRNRKYWSEIQDRRAWLARTAWRVAQGRRKKATDVGIDEAAEAVLGLKAQGAGADEVAANREMMVLLELLIAALPRDLRDVLTLSTVEDLSSGEISELLGIPQGSVRTRLRRARGILREKLSAVLETKHERPR